MPRRSRFLPSRLSLLREGTPKPYRPLLVGPAILLCTGRPDGLRSKWSMTVHPGSPLVPVVTAGARRFARTVRLLASQGVVHRVAAAIATPLDFQRPGPISIGDRSVASSGGPEAARSIYGWSLAYRLPGDNGPATIDPHDEIPELPAFYESAGELLDRIHFLEERGVATRPIALLVQEGDFETLRDGTPPVNRFFPQLLIPGGS